MLVYKKVYIEITNICNMNCSFCKKSIRKKQEMSVDNFKTILDKIKPYTSYIYLHVKGEPLLHSKLDKILKIAEEKNFKVNITTNGTLLNQQINTIIKNKCIRQINVSLHSNVESYQYLYSVIMSTKQIIKNTNIVFSYRLWNRKNGINNQNNNIIKALENEFNCTIDTNAKNVKLDKNLYLNFDNVFNWPDLNNKIYNEQGRCYGLKTHIGILVDGTIIPCCLDDDGIINLGNIFKDDLKDVISSKRYTNIINNFKDNKKCEELCKHCDFIK